MTEARPRILVADAIAPEGVARLGEVGDVDVRTGLSPDDLRAAVGPYQAIVVRSASRITREIIEAAPDLQVVGRAGVGVDNIDLDAATERGVIVVNAPQGNTIAAAEHTIALLMAMARHISPADASMHASQWARSSFLGVEIRGKTLGVLGLGNVGGEVARRAVGLEMRVLGYDPFVPEERAAALGVERCELDRIFRESDFITVHVPLTAANKGIIGAGEIALMKPTVRLINVARGGVIDEEDLAAALVEGRVAAAAVDVFTDEPPAAGNPLLTAPNALLTPHLGASTAEAQERAALDVADQIVDVLSGRLARYAVNAPLLPPETMRVIGPFLKAAELIGSIGTQLVIGNLTSLEIEYYGDIAEHDVAPLRASVIKGLMAPISDENVNLVNATFVAQGRGWHIDERLRDSHDIFHNLIHLRLGTSDSEVSVGGSTHHGGHPNIVILNGMDVDLVPEPGTFLLICDNDDRPGMIGRLGTVLGSFDINISSMQVGRTEKRGRALMILGLDESPDDEQLSQIEAIDGIYNIRIVRL